MWIELTKPANYYPHPPAGLPANYIAAGSRHDVPEHVAKVLIEAGEAVRCDEPSVGIAKDESPFVANAEGDVEPLFEPEPLAGKKKGR